MRSLSFPEVFYQKIACAISYLPLSVSPAGGPRLRRERGIRRIVYHEIPGCGDVSDLSTTAAPQEQRQDADQRDAESALTVR